MKLIYLDLDGVINCQDAFIAGECRYVKHNDKPDDDEEKIKNYHQSFYSKSKYWLNRLIKETDAKIIISSTWRGSGIKWLEEVWKHEKMEGKINGVTPSFASVKVSDERYRLPRGCEIEYHLEKTMGFHHINWSKEKQQEYMDESSVDNYIIIDDDSDMLYSQRNHYLQVLPAPRCTSGFGEEHYLKGLEMLSKTVIDLNY